MRPTPIKPRLTKTLLWADLKSMDEFVKLAPITAEFAKVYQTIQQQQRYVKWDAVTVFNEAYYLTTKIVHERPCRGREVVTYAKICSKDLTRSYSAELVMPIVYQLLLMLERRPHSIRRSFTGAIAKCYGRSKFWHYFADHFKGLSEETEVLSHSFSPRPIRAELLRDRQYDWEQITLGYSVDAMAKVLKLWRSREERAQVAEVLLNALKSKLLTTMGDGPTPRTIVNNFASGSTAQVFNGDVNNGTFN